MFCRGTLFRVGEIWISQRIDPADNLFNRSAYVCGLLCRVLTSRGHPVSASVCWVSRVPAASPMTGPLRLCRLSHPHQAISLGDPTS